MIDLLILMLINSFVCFGFWNACLYEVEKVKVETGYLENFKKQYRYEDKEIKGVLWRLEKWGKDKFIYKAIGGCLPCMASLHSIFPYWAYMYSTNAINLNALLFYPVYVLALSGVNFLIENKL